MSDMQKLLNLVEKISFDERSKYHVTLGSLVVFLGTHPGEKLVRFSDGTYPGKLRSYRGYYSDLAFERSDVQRTVSDVLATCTDALGTTFEGYKGGDYVARPTTPLWAAPWGSTGDAVVRVVSGADAVYLVLKEIS